MSALLDLVDSVYFPLLGLMIVAGIMSFAYQLSVGMKFVLPRKLWLMLLAVNLVGLLFAIVTRLTNQVSADTNRLLMLLFIGPLFVVAAYPFLALPQKATGR